MPGIYKTAHLNSEENQRNNREAPPTSAAEVESAAAANAKVSRDYLESLESELREVWSQYMNCVERDGSSERAKTLRERYFSLYRNYRNNKEWRGIITSN